ncbi:hypothetical protein [Brevibacterium yomogidense]|uniref:hypothetical protein n=1 Tax=Brevibacterium yomogidense TaxID=946573 RepID=UPI0018E05973|nr:hypothetical protein [Brevibacterium yomogidense]
MLMGMLVVTGSILVLYYFVRGRMVCPRHDRLPLGDLGVSGWIHTISRGWAADSPRDRYMTGMA